MCGFFCGYRWLRKAVSGYGSFQVVTGGYGVVTVGYKWLRMVMGSYGVVTCRYDPWGGNRWIFFGNGWLRIVTSDSGWFWVVMSCYGWLRVLTGG